MLAEQTGFRLSERVHLKVINNDDDNNNVEGSRKIWNAGLRPPHMQAHVHAHCHTEVGIYVCAHKYTHTHVYMHTHQIK